VNQEPSAANVLLELCNIPYQLWISASEIDRIIAENPDLQNRESYLRLMLSLEAPNIDDGFVNEPQPPFIGLAQFNRDTWDSISTLPFSEALDPVQGLKGAVSLYNSNKRSFERKFDGTYTDEIAYLYHNQGAPSAAQFLRTGVLKYPKQSRKALALFERI
jgi:hypothetical protein